MRGSQALIALSIAGLLAAGVSGAAEPVFAERQMVVAANPHAAEAGIRILREGGSAVDAAIAVSKSAPRSASASIRGVVSAGKP